MQSNFNGIFYQVFMEEEAAYTGMTVMNISFHLAVENAMATAFSLAGKIGLVDKIRAPTWSITKGTDYDNGVALNDVFGARQRLFIVVRTIAELSVPEDVVKAACEDLLARIKNTETSLDEALRSTESRCNVWKQFYQKMVES